MTSSAPSGSSTAVRGRGVARRERAPAPTRRRPLRYKAYPYLFMLPALVLVATVFAFPIVQGFWTSLHEPSFQITERGAFVGFGIYADLLENPAFWNSMTNSVVFVLGTIFGGTALALVFALTLYYAPALHKSLRALSLIPWLISGVAVAWVFRFWFNGDVGIMNRITSVFGYDPGTWLGDPDRAMFVVIVANTWSLLPFGTLLLLAALQMLDRDLFDAAKVDGATPWQLFHRVTLPQLMPHLGLVLVVLSFSAWNTFDLVLAMTAGGPRGATDVLALFMYRRAFQQLDFADGAALMVIILLINIVLSVGYLYWTRERN